MSGAFRNVKTWMKIAKILGFTVLLLAAVSVCLWKYHAHHTQKIRTFLAHEIVRYVDAVSANQSNVVFQCEDGCWLGRVQFRDGDWAGP